jgi:hypothetical protein
MQFVSPAPASLSLLLLGACSTAPPLAGNGHAEIPVLRG